MPANKLALIRYKTIDQCLCNRHRKWTLEALVDKVSDVLYEYEGRKDGISKRTIQLDIQNMRSDKLGYNAPIIVVDKKYYTYEDKDFSITKTALSKHDLDTLNDVLKVLEQFKGFPSFEDISTVISRIEAKTNVYNEKKVSYIQFEKNDLLKGLTWIEPLHEAIKDKKVLNVTYQSFKSVNESYITIYPYLLKEYRNRWFLLCKKSSSSGVLLLALDRIQAISSEKKIKYEKPDFDVQHFFDDVIGVTKTLNQKPSKVVLKASSYQAPYILTKPLHPSQVVNTTTDEGEIIFSIDVILNYELEREIIGFGEGIEVLSPRNLRKTIKRKFELGLAIYNKVQE